MNARRRLLIVLGAAPFAPRTVFAQAKKQPVLIGWLSSGNLGQRSLVAFKEGLAALGWKEGAQIVIEGRWAEGDVDRLGSLTQELVAKKAALIVASDTRAASNAVRSAPTMPIVMISTLDPITAGFVTNLARPGGMITGIGGFNIDITGKHVELLLAAAPKVKRVGFITSARGPLLDALLEAARRAVTHHAVEARYVEVQRLEQIEPALSRLVTEEVHALVALTGAVVTASQRQILTFAMTRRWPVIAAGTTWAENGALLSYAASTAASARRAAYYVDRILKGAKPGDLPIEQPTTFELLVNMRTAKTLGLTMPPEIMVRANRVIE